MRTMQKPIILLLVLGVLVSGCTTARTRATPTPPPTPVYIVPMDIPLDIPGLFMLDGELKGQAAVPADKVISALVEEFQEKGWVVEKPPHIPNAFVAYKGPWKVQVKAESKKLTTITIRIQRLGYEDKSGRLW